MVYVCPAADAVRGVIFPFCIGTAFACRLIGLPYVHTKSGGKAIRVVRVVVVDRAVSIHIHEIRGFAGIRGTEPPINGCTEYNPNHAGRRAIALCRSA